MAYLYNLGLHFKDIVHRQGERTALRFCDGNQLSFTALDALSDQIAQCLLERGLHAGQVVAIQNNKSPFGYACILACVKLGLVYTNFDSANPKERLGKIFHTAAPALVVSDTPLAPAVQELCEEMGLPCFDYSQRKAQQEVESSPPRLDSTILRSVTGAQPAYIMFTSGSTGIPKGVLIRHDAVLHFIDWCQETFAITPDDNLTNVNPIYFDNSVFDFYASLFNGASLSAFPLDIVARPAQLLEAIDRLACTFWFSVPSFLIYLNNLKLLTPGTFTHIRAIAFGGEGYPKESLKKLYDLYQDRATLFNVYGPTECTCMCSAYKITDQDFVDMHGIPTLGSLAPNFSSLLLDSEGQPGPVGELCLLGPQLALGYYNDPERTRKAFVQNPLNTRYAQTMYKTGDLVEQRADGLLYFLGRADNQIKHMGYRIELEEIEAGLAQLPYTLQCAVVHGKNAHGFSHLTAYVASHQEISPEQVRADLRRYLPEYMVPNHFEFVPELPKNANGKVDRIQLKILAGLT